MGPTNQSVAPKNYLEKAELDFSNSGSEYTEDKLIELIELFHNPKVPVSFKQSKPINLLFALLQAPDVKNSFKASIYDILKIALLSYTDDLFQREIEQEHLCRLEIKSVRLILDESKMPDKIFITMLSPNRNERKSEKAPDPKIHTLIHHFTVSSFPRAMLLFSIPEKSTENTLSPYCKNAAVSSHYIVDRSGLIVIAVPEEEKAWHAGFSKWQGCGNLNPYSIGIENVNRGYTVDETTGNVTWEEFPEEQILSTLNLTADIMSRYGISPSRVIGHQDITPNRKQDPGPKFPWKKLEKKNLVTTAYDILLSPEDCNVLCVKEGEHEPNGLEVKKMTEMLIELGYYLDCPLNANTKELLQHLSPNGCGEARDTFDKRLVPVVNAFRARAMQDCPAPKPNQDFAIWDKGCEKRAQRMIEKQKAIQQQAKSQLSNTNGLSEPEFENIIQSLEPYNQQVIIHAEGSAIIGVIPKIENAEKKSSGVTVHQIENARKTPQERDDVLAITSACPVLSYLQKLQTTAQTCSGSTEAESAPANDLPKQTDNPIKIGLEAVFSLSRKNATGAQTTENNQTIHAKPPSASCYAALNKLIEATVQYQEKAAQTCSGSTEAESAPANDLPQPATKHPCSKPSNYYSITPLDIYNNGLAEIQDPSGTLDGTQEACLNKVKNDFSDTLWDRKVKASSTPDDKAAQPMPSGSLKKSFATAALAASMEGEMVGRADNPEEAPLTKTQKCQPPVPTPLDNVQSILADQKTAQHGNGQKPTFYLCDEGCTQAH